MMTTTSFKALATFALLALAPLAHAAEVPASVYVRSISFAGSGCPAGSVASHISPDRTAMTLDFDSFVAETGPGVSFSQSRKNCQINLDLAIPGGWSYAIKSIDLDGYVSLERGVVARTSTMVYFQGQTTQARLSSTFTGPTDRDFTIRDSFGATGLVWSPCGASRALNVNLQASISGSRTSHGLISLDSPFALGHSVRLVFRRC